MSKDKLNMPMGTAGITRYFDDYKSRIEITPGHVIVLIVLVIIIEILLFSFGGPIFGIS